jgi:hypothetical protein
MQSAPHPEDDKKAVAGVDNTSRRQYDIEEFRAKAARREIEESELDGLTAEEIKKLKRRSTHSTLHICPCSAHCTRSSNNQWSICAIRIWGTHRGMPPCLAPIADTHTIALISGGSVSTYMHIPSIRQSSL